MEVQNRVMGSMTAENVANIQAALKVIRDNLPPLQALTTQQRRELPKMGMKSVGLDELCARAMQANPELIPPYIDVAALKTARALRAELMVCHIEVKALFEELDDTLMLLSSQIWSQDLAFYGAVRTAAMRGVPGAETLYADLRKHFPGGGGGPDDPTPPGPDGPATEEARPG